MARRIQLKMFLKILQNSQENACGRVPLFKKLQVTGLQPAALIKKRFQHRYFIVVLAKLFRTPFL